MKDKVKIITQVNDSQIKDLYQLYQLSWWSQGRMLDGIKIMLENSDLIIGLSHCETEKLIGFARVLTDYVYRATIWDVMVDPSYQKKGLGSLLMESIMNHQSLRNVECFSLMCLPEAIPFYEKFEFATYHKPIEIMIRSRHS